MSSLLNKILGRPLASSEGQKEKLTVATGVPVLGLDALASTAYGPEAALLLLTVAGTVAIEKLPFVIAGILLLLTLLYFSYQQTVAAYANGGGAYIVAKENLGAYAGVVAAGCLLVDYMLNVAVGISAGIAAVQSAFPILHKHTLALCLAVLATLTFVNLRGVRESGMVFNLPTCAFVFCLVIVTVIGVVHVVRSGFQPQPVVPPPPIPPPHEALTWWVLLRAFAGGCTAMTGVEAISNGVPLFAEPRVKHAQRSLTVIVSTLGILLLGIGWLCSAYHIGAMDQREHGYQTALSQLVAATCGHGFFYYFSIISILIILTFSANTSFADFPRVCRLLATDRYLPEFFAEKGRRLVFSLGINVLALCSAVLLICFGGVTENLIPLFAVGAFSAFTFSQTGMVMYWWRKRGPKWRLSLALNAAGAIATAIALIIIIAAKFVEGAWVTVFVLVGLTTLFFSIRRHYEHVAREIDTPIQIGATKLEPPMVVIPISGWDRVAEKALQFALSIADDITALHVAREEKADKDDCRHLRELWADKVEAPARAAHVKVPSLRIVYDRYRRLYKPVLDFVKQTAKEHKNRVIAVVIPEPVEPRWYHLFLHNQTAAGLRALLLRQGDQRTVVITTPFYLRERA